MNHQEKIDWMIKWAHENKARIELEGECGFGRECVGLLVNETWPDYEWYDEDYEKQLDENGEVWCPDAAYHKHPCVAVLGRGEEAESQLYDWIKWFDDNDFKVEVSKADASEYEGMGTIGLLMGRDKNCRMVKK